MARVSDLGTTSEAFPVTNGTKQGCVMAPLLFCIIFSAMLQDAFKNCYSGVMIRFRSDGSIFNLQRLKARTKVSLLLLRWFKYACICIKLLHLFTFLLTAATCARQAPILVLVQSWTVTVDTYFTIKFLVVVVSCSNCRWYYFSYH